MTLDLCLEHQQTLNGCLYPIKVSIKFCLLHVRVSNYVIGIPIQKANAVTIAEALLNRVLYLFSPPKTLITDENRTLSADVLMHV